MMWTSDLHQVDSLTTKISLMVESQPLSFHEVIKLWRDNVEFRTFFTKTISRSSFEAFFWETPPVTSQTLNRPFEFVLVASTSLSRLSPDSSAFEPHFSARKSEAVLSFPNLGGDAVLVVPVPLADNSCYPHLAKFIRNAPESQIDAFWRAAGQAMHDRISEAPVWLSTAGLGVSWLHLRLDSRPKYYRHEPYKVYA